MSTNQGSDRANLQLVKTQDGVDRINREFYGRFNYPWPPMILESFPEPEFAAGLLQQEIGRWQRDRLPEEPEIWVAGCGTNQAVYTALRFPHARVLGTDLSQPSLETCRRSAQQVGADNLRLEERSLNHVDYKNRFDYIICTGVIHHNADPALPLRNLAAALKPGGILELMVYNYYHRIQAVTYQKAVRTLCGEGRRMNLDAELEATKKLIDRFPARNFMADFLSQYRDQPEAMLADTLLQPVERGYTVESLEELATHADLEFLLPCINVFDRNEGNTHWNLKFEDAALQQTYDALPDSRRWQIANLLLFEKSPRLWFYLQRRDSPHPRQDEKTVCQSFLATRFEKQQTTKKIFMRQKDGVYRPEERPVPFHTPLMPADADARKAFLAVTPDRTMGEVLENLGLAMDFYAVNRLRLHLTTPAFPYLRALL